MKINSRVLFSMATRLSSASGTGADPMANVRKMLNNLITTLESESSEEPLTGGCWCRRLKVCFLLFCVSDAHQLDHPVWVSWLDYLHNLVDVEGAEFGVAPAGMCSTT